MSATRITFATLATSLLAVGTAAAEPMTLAKCIDVALQGNPDIASANLEVEATTAQKNSARGAFGPRLHMDAGIQRWDSPLTASFADMLIPVVNVGLGKNHLTTIDKTDFADPNTPQLAALAKPIELRAQTTWSASFTLAQPIASLWTINEGYALRKMGVDLAGLQRKATRRARRRLPGDRGLLPRSAGHAPGRCGAKVGREYRRAGQARTIFLPSRNRGSQRRAAR